MNGDASLSWLMFFTLAAGVIVAAGFFLQFLSSRHNRTIAASALGGEQPFAWCRARRRGSRVSGASGSSYRRHGVGSIKSRNCCHQKGNVCQYRIKSTDKPHERVVRWRYRGAVGNHSVIRASGSAQFDVYLPTIIPCGIGGAIMFV